MRSTETTGPGSSLTGEPESATIGGMETWRSIEGFIGIYEVSDEGRVRRCGADKPLRPYDRGGYPCVGLKTSGRRRQASVHSLVLEAFVGPRAPGMQGAHLDGNPLHSAARNLAWVTQSENEGHKRGHGTVRTGERSHVAKLTNEQAQIVREIAAAGITQTKIAKLVGVRDETIGNIVRHITFR